MPGGKFDSSLTRVAPVFDRLSTQPADWPARLLALAQCAAPDAVDWRKLDLRYVNGWWGDRERGLRPPVSLLSWLVRHPESWASKPCSAERLRLQSGDPATVSQALELLRSSGADRGWFIFEGRTFPDALIETQDALIVVEGKRTESGPTTHTTWMGMRHQIWRHIDAAWEVRGRRKVLGLFIVEDDGSGLPTVWREAAGEAVAEQALAGSFPHRSARETAELRRCFLGVATWASVCRAFGINMRDLPDTV